MTEPAAKAHSPIARHAVPKAAPGDQTSIAAQYARAKARQDAEDQSNVKKILADHGIGGKGEKKSTIERLNERKAARFRAEWIWVVGFFLWLL